MNFWQFFWPKTLEKTSSLFNSKIEVKEFLGKRFLRVNDMTQSGGMAEDIYEKIFPLPNFFSVNNILILGFGGGSFAKLVNKKYPQAKIVGVEIDKKIIDIAKKYFQVNKIKNLTIVNADAIEFVDNYYNTVQYHSKFDLIFVDLYHGEEIEKKIETEIFLKNLNKLLAKNGLIIFNRLNFKKHKKENERFLERLKGLFGNVTTKKAYSNLIVYCQI